MRIDRFVTLNLVQPWRRALAACLPEGRLRSSAWPVPVLMYHSITDSPEPGIAPYYQVNTSPAAFRSQMRWLAESGYRTISLAELCTQLSQVSGNGSSEGSDQAATQANGKLRGEKVVAITFDDGFRNFYTDAFPILQQHAFAATVFLPTGFIGHTRQMFRPAGSLALQPAEPSECLTWSEVRELASHGIDFGSHTVSHPKLVNLPWSGIRAEISDSKSEIECHLGQPVSSFCYPYAFPQANSEFRTRFGLALAEAGYSCCTTTQVGRVGVGDNPLELKRLPVNSLDDSELLAAKVRGFYDWLASAQALVKKVKSAA